jgi:hypothetical protein
MDRCSEEWPAHFPVLGDDATPREAEAYLRDGQQRLRDSVAALSEDAELLRPRRSNWGERYETRWLVNKLVQHDLYHAGEINHLRALRHGDDRWPWASRAPT